MTVADLIAVLQQADDPQAPAIVRVWGTDDPSGEPVFSRCAIRDVTEQHGRIIIDAEEA